MFKESEDFTDAVIGFMTGPERAMEGFMSAWKGRDWMRMYQLTQLTWRDAKQPGDLSDMFAVKSLEAHRIVSSFPVSDCRVNFLVEITYSLKGARVTERIKASVICEAEPYKARSDGEWGVNPISALAVVRS